MFTVQKIFHPEIYQGRHKRDHYFEGWYFLQVNKECSHSVALIPGVSLNRNDPHAFIQVILTNRDWENPVEKNHESPLITDYFRFSLSDFQFEDAPFRIRIGNNIFSNSNIDFNLNNATLHVEGHFLFGDQQKIQQNLLTPNIMGFFGYLSCMECYHGVISMRHALNGEASINGRPISFQDGTGYIEKDWGCSFPQNYVWVQCNHFQTKEASLMLSVAQIPFLGTAFKGFICNLVVDGKEYRMATYNRSKIILEQIEGNVVHYKIRKKQLTLSIRAEITENAALKAPKRGYMGQVIKEGLSGKVHIQMVDHIGNILHEDDGICAGVEIVNGSD